MARPGVRVEIVTPVHNRKALTLGCLRSIAAIDRDGLDVHVVVVDDGSADGTADAIAAEHPDVEVIRGDGTLWFTAGTNVGVRRALTRHPDFVLMINDDQLFDPQCLRAMVDTARAYPRSVVGALLFRWDTPDRLFQTAPVWDTWRGGWRHWYHQSSRTVPDRPWTVDLIVGNCVLVPREAFDACGLMDARRFPNFGDAEFTPRLRKAGWRLIIDPRAHVRCQPNSARRSVRTLRRAAMVRHLVTELGHPDNVRRRFYAYWHGAPTPLHGLVAFVMFFLRWALGRNIEGAWALAQKEPPLRDTFAARVLDAPLAAAPSTAPCAAGMTRPGPGSAATSTGIGRHVIYAWNYVEWGGAQVYFWALMREANRHASVEVLLPIGSHPRVLATLEQMGIPYEIAFPAMDGRAAPTLGRKIAVHVAKVRSELAMVRALCRRSRGEAVMHVDLAPWQSMVALWWLSRHAHVFVTCHTALVRHSWWREHLWRLKLGVLARCRRFRILASNQNARQSLARFLPASVLAQVQIIYTGVNPVEIDAVRAESRDRAALRARFALPPKPFLVVCVGQFIDRKGRWPFLEAARAIATVHDDIGFVWLANSAPDPADLDKVAQHGLGAAFRLLTAADLGVDHREVFRVVCAGDVFCLPTLTDGLPGALLEAMALGLPAISTPVFAIPEAITDGETGLLAAAGDAVGLARAMLALRNDPSLRARLAARGRAHVLASFDERVSAERAWTTYRAAADW